MRVDCKIDPNCNEPFAVLHIKKITAPIGEAIALLENADKEDSNIFAQKDGKTFLLDPQNIELIRTEGRDVMVYDKLKAVYRLNRTLYELEEILGRQFARISKSTIINIKRINHVEASFNGTMEIVMKNGVEDYISRNYRKSFKERLGLE